MHTTTTTWSPFLTPVNMGTCAHHPCWQLFTGVKNISHEHGPWKRVVCTRYQPCWKSIAWQCFVQHGSWTRAVFKHLATLPVFTARKHGPYTWVSKMTTNGCHFAHLCLGPVNTGSAYLPLVCWPIAIKWARELLRKVIYSQPRRPIPNPSLQYLLLL